MNSITVNSMIKQEKKKCSELRRQTENFKKTLINLTDKLESRKTTADKITGMKEMLEIIVAKAEGRYRN